MYTITTTYTKRNLVWNEEDITTLTLKNILLLANARISLTWDGDFEEDFFVSENKTLLRNSDQTQTLAAWVATLNEGDLITTAKARGLVDVNCLTTAWLYENSTNVQASNINFGEGNEIPPGIDVDLKFQGKTETSNNVFSTENISKNMLLSVNGKVYPITAYNGWNWAMGAIKQMRYDQEDSMLLLNFAALGGIDIIPITEENLTQFTRDPVPGADPKSYFRVDLSISSKDKIPLLVTDGYLRVLDGTYKLLDNNTLIVELDHYTAIKRVANETAYTRPWISAANLEGEGYLVDSFDSVKYMQSSNSFVVLVGTKDLAILREPITNTKLPNIYHHYRIPKGLIFFSGGKLTNGKICDYNENTVAITTITNRKPVSVADVTPLSAQSTFIDQGFSTKPIGYDEAYVLELYSFA